MFCPVCAAVSACAPEKTLPSPEPSGRLRKPYLRVGETPLCECGAPCVLASVHKEGPNRGRRFFRCARKKRAAR